MSKSKKVDYFEGTPFRKVYPMAKEEKLPIETKMIYKILDAISWDLLQKYFRNRSDRELAKYKYKELKLKIKKEASNEARSL